MSRSATRALCAALVLRLLPDQDTAAFHRALDRVIGDTSVHSVVFPGVTPSYVASLNTARACRLMVGVVEAVQ